ncbi:MAG: S16 family serine protease [Bacillota bacterium]
MRIIRRAFLCSALLSFLLLVYDLPSVVADDYLYYVTGYHPPEELIGGTDIYIIGVSKEIIGGVENEQVLRDMFITEGKKFYEIIPITNGIRYRNKNQSILMWIGLDKNHVERMSEDVSGFLMEREVMSSKLVVDDFLQRDNIDGDSAGLALVLASMASEGVIDNKVKIAVTGAISRSGKVKEVGAIKEKLMIAVENDFPYIVTPEENLAEANRIKEKYDLDIKIIGVTDVVEAINEIEKVNNLSNKY